MSVKKSVTSGERPYVSELGQFESGVSTALEEAMARRRALLEEIALHEAEIAGRRERVAEQEAIILRCEAALAVGRSVPAAQVAPASQVVIAEERGSVTLEQDGRAEAARRATYFAGEDR